MTPEAATAALETNAAWLQECAVLLLCVLALDHFADYAGDQVGSGGYQCCCCVCWDLRQLG